jgi:hypothetical protein
MAKTLISTCDVHADGETASSKMVTLSMGKRRWTVDVCAAHEAELVAFMDRFSPSSIRKKAASESQAAKEKRAALREWAKKNKIKLPQRGRIPQDVIAKYEASLKR